MYNERLSGLAMMSIHWDLMDLHNKKLAIFKSYLEGREQVVDMKGCFSNVVDVSMESRNDSF
jgi:hypothetical protein